VKQKIGTLSEGQKGLVALACLVLGQVVVVLFLVRLLFFIIFI
jgi:ATPase subunit of ABC transporter with duplicated ATPase domains